MEQCRPEVGERRLGGNAVFVGQSGHELVLASLRDARKVFGF
jgi:hypothetical protein